MGAYDNPTDFAYRVLIVLGLTALFVLTLVLLGNMLHVLLLVFAAVLATVAVDGVVRLFQRYTPLSRGWSLAATGLVIVALIAAAIGFIWPQAAAQMPKLAEQLPTAAAELVGRLQQLPVADEIMGQAEESVEDTRFLEQDFMGQVLGVFSTTFGAIGSVLLILLIAFYLVLSPRHYLDDLLALLPPASRPRYREVFAAQGHALRLWLLGRLLSMVFVGVFVAIGLMLLGVPMAFALGLIAGLATFIPYLGPILGAIPALLVAFLQGPEILLYVAILYIVVETLESSVIYPLAQRRVVHIPPAYTVIIQLAGGVVAGLPGVILATPLAVAAAVAVQMLYVQDVLHQQVEVLGEE
jgi:predicted PurR-regulated permease PerM